MKEFDSTEGWELIGQRATADNSLVVRTTETHTVFLVKVITWDGVATPVVHLEDVKTIKNPTDNQTIADIKEKLLNHKNISGPARVVKNELMQVIAGTMKLTAWHGRLHQRKNEIVARGVRAQQMGLHDHA